MVRRRSRGRRSRARRRFAHAHRWHWAATCCMTGGSIHRAEGSDLQFSSLRCGTDAPAAGQIGVSRRWVWVENVARQVHIDQGDVPMSTLNRRGDALHRLGSGLFGEDVAGSKFHYGRSRPTSRQARSGPREPWRHVTSQDRGVEEHVPAPAQQRSVTASLRRPCRLEMNDSRSGSGFLHIRGAEPERPDFRNRSS